MNKRIYPCPAFPHFIHGADYNPEQWIDDKSIWDQDMQLMQLANCNEMSVGIFSWSMLEPREGEYDFSFLDKADFFGTFLAAFFFGFGSALGRSFFSASLK